MIIQGVCDPACVLRYVEEYTGTFDEILLSTYPSMVHPSLQGKIHTVLSDPGTGGAYNFQNILLHVRSIIKGLESSSGDYCLKVRGDEFYSGLDALDFEGDKLLCNNVFFSPNVRLHISDHLMGMPRPLFESTCALMLGRIMSGKAFPKPGEEGFMGAEQFFFRSYLEARGESAEEGSWEALIHRYISLIFVEDQEPLTISCNSVKERYGSAAEYYTNPTIADNRLRGIMDKGTYERLLAQLPRPKPPGARLDSFTKGWLVGDFSPALLCSKDVEVGVKYYKAGDAESRHVHKVATEHTIVLTGRVRMDGKDYLAKDVVTIPPGVSTDFQCLEDAITLVIKSPSLPQDKYPA